MSLFPKTEWTDWAAAWGFKHLPQNGWMLRNERMFGVREGRLVEVGWGGENNASLVVRVRFRRVEDVQGVRQGLIADTMLDTLPGKGAKRRKMILDGDTSKRRNGRVLPEFTLGDQSLTWARRFPWSSPRPEQLRTWVEALLAAIGRATQPFDGHCERCNAANVRGFVLVDATPMIMCSACQQHLRTEGDLAERSYEMQDANHLRGTTLGLLAASVGALVWAVLSLVTGKIFAAVAIAIGLGVARAYRRGAGRVDTSGQVIGGALTLGSVVLGDLLLIMLSLSRNPTMGGVSLGRALAIYSSVLEKSPGKLAVPLAFGLLGVWVSTRALRRPKLRADIRNSDADPRKTQSKAA
jgi:hypothetical protein